MTTTTRCQPAAGTAPSGATAFAPAPPSAPVPGVAFAGQGVPAEAVLETLARFERHPLVTALLTAVGAAGADGLDLADTRVAQPATYVAGLVRAHSCPGPAAMAPVVVGHSLGEITALAYAGVVAPEDGLRIALTRGEICHAVQDRRPGAMAAVTGLDHDGVEWLRRRVVAHGHGILEVAGINGRRQVVLSGDRGAVAALVEYAGQTSGRVTVLPINGGFHSPLMMDAVPSWRRFLASVPFVRSTTTVISCIDCRQHSEPNDFRELLARALVLPVRWVETMAAVRQFGVRTLWEAGPGRVLRTLGKRSTVLEFVERPECRPVG